MGRKNINKIAHILRNKETKTAVLMIKTRYPWQVFGGYTIDSIDYSVPLLKGDSSGIFNLDIDVGRHLFFEVQVKDRKGIIAEKHLPMTCGYNFRDLGGIEGYNRKTIRWGRIFRSDDLQDLSSEDVLYLGSIPISSIIDLRSQGEIKQSPDKLPTSVRRVFPLSITSGNLSPERIQASLGSDNMDSLMIEMNRLFVTEPVCIENFRIMFRILQDRSNLPLLYHCSAGKDRAGMATALILFSLGVSEKAVIQDYMLSKEYLADKYALIIEKYPKIEPLFSVKPEYIKAGIEQMKKKHKTVENYLINVLNVDIERMRRLYLE